ncbi:PEP/pyruvate-binding domain-containing protein [Nocardioides sp. CFH 31398]|uniref:PEP/pyruvate-binding domain-containing protein n=1 Tax=Nocardioides sp. CFH 31398 TaxID=2919579 RepID=UPI001F058D75|nr:PEP/pyruvate-binding domain-containing protein [Nocardioides sp. CFH 31398]MCH1865502.1 phosphoenolpyruvate synthase [Nocardioides sp. CFH 31398]
MPDLITRHEEGPSVSVTDTPAIRWFDELRKDDRPQVGGKCASLGELTSAGIPVPRGFAITVDAWEQVIEHGGLREQISSWTAGVDPGDNAALREVQRHAVEIIGAAPIPEHVESAIRAGYAELCARAGVAEVPVAVRSSAVAEDGEATSFAGQQETYLWVVGIDEVVARIRDCWASLFTPQAIAYRSKLDDQARYEAVLMSVAVQEMVDAEVAGVGFTVSPRTGDPSVMAVNASWGLGETVVSGEVTPDEFWIDKVQRSVRSRTITHKEQQCVPAPGGTGTATVPVPAERADEPSLDDQQLRELADIMVSVERHYGAPQDIEWAMARDADGSHRFLLLQSRPETVVTARRATTPAPSPVTSYLSMVQSLSSRAGGGS